MAAPGGDRVGAGQAAHLDGRARARGCVVAELTVAVVSPAFDGPARRERGRAWPPPVMAVEPEAAHDDGAWPSLVVVSLPS